MAHDTDDAFPDDSPFAATVRRIDTTLGRIEQGLLFGVLALVVIVASVQALAAKLWHINFAWSFEIIRNGVFFIALIGAAFAAQLDRHLAMDLVTKRLPAKGQIVLTMLIAVFTLGLVLLLARAGLHVYHSVEPKGHIISDKHVALMIPIGALLVGAHMVMRLIIFTDYLRRGKPLPSRQRTH